MPITLLSKVCLLVGLVASVEAFILLCPLSRSALTYPYFDAWRAKHQRLVGRGQNRLILVGGSNVAFGVDSSKLQTVSQRETINLGLHGGLGLAFMLREVEEGARAGDLVVLIPEYEHFYGDLMNGELEAAELLQSDWSALRYFSSWRQLRNLLKNSLILTAKEELALLDKGKITLLGRDDPVRAVETVYTSGAFDVHGDMVAHLGQASRLDRVTFGIERIRGEFNHDAIEAIARCAEILASHGVEFVVAYPAVAAGYWAVNRDLAEQVAARMPSQWTITQPEDWVFEHRLFFDTSYHLNRRGRDVRTEQLIRVLKPGHAGQRKRHS